MWHISQEQDHVWGFVWEGECPCPYSLSLWEGRSRHYMSFHHDTCPSFPDSCNLDYHALPHWKWTVSEQDPDLHLFLWSLLDVYSLVSNHEIKIFFLPNKMPVKFKSISFEKNISENIQSICIYSEILSLKCRKIMETVGGCWFPLRFRTLFKVSVFWVSPQISWVRQKIKCLEGRLGREGLEHVWWDGIWALTTELGRKRTGRCEQEVLEWAGDCRRGH